MKPQLLTPDRIHKQALRLWQRGVVMCARLRDQPLAPIVLRCRPPSAGAIPDAFDEVREWIRALRDGSKERIGYGYVIDFEEVEHRRLGRQSLPARVRFETVEDLLRLIGKHTDFERFCGIARSTLAEWPALRDWLLQSPHEALAHEAAWSRLLAVLAYVRDNPRPNRYLRELPIAGVDTKFIEIHKPLLRDLLDVVLPPGAIDSTVTTLSGRGFEKRYGFLYDEPLIRFRLLDPALAPSWPARDLSVTFGEFCTLDVPCRRVFITENKLNGLAFPEVSESIVVFGLGYGVEALADVPWLAGRELHYWGDIDAHGLAILSRFRSRFPAARAFCMDRQTITIHQSLCGPAKDGEPPAGLIADSLTAEEHALYDALQSGELGPRLEQERIPWDHVRSCLREVVGDG